MGEGAVDDRTAYGGERISALLDRSRIDGHEAPALVGAEGGADVRRDRRGCSFDFDGPDGEE